MKTIKRSIRRRRLLLLFWSGILLSSILIVGQAFSTSTTYLATESSGTLQDRTFAGADACKACHAEKYESWTGTLHNVAWNSSTHFSPDRECGFCHVNGTNWESGKWIGEDLFGFTASNAPQDEGVSCETCHGPYDGGAGSGHMYVSLSPDLCGECHSPFHSTHGQAYANWSKSGHAHAHTTLIETGAEVPRCIHCHSAEGAIPWPLGGVNTFAEMENGITCAVCHNPHSSENTHQFREPSVNELCITCHSHETPDEPHLLRGADCATCHMHGPQFSTRTNSWDSPANHTMGAWVGACAQEGCHANPEAAWAAKDALVELFGEKYMEAEEVVEEARAAFEMANTTAGADMMKLGEAEAKLAELEDVWHEAELSETLAFHSSWHLEEMLDEVTSLARDVEELSEDAMEPAGMTTVTMVSTVSEHSLQILAILGISSALLVAVFRRRRVN